MIELSGGASTSLTIVAEASHDEFASYGTDSEAGFGETARTSGFSGGGKLIPPCVAVGSADYIGSTVAVGRLPVGALVYCCGAGTTP